MGYTHIASHILRDYPSVLRPTELLVYLYLIQETFIQKHIEVSISQKCLQNATGLSHVTIRRVIRKLLQKGFIKITKGHHLKFPTTYWVCRNTYEPESNHFQWQGSKEFETINPLVLEKTRAEMEQAMRSHIYLDWKGKLDNQTVGVIFAEARKLGRTITEAAFERYFQTHIWQSLLESSSDEAIAKLYLKYCENGDSK